MGEDLTVTAVLPVLAAGTALAAFVLLLARAARRDGRRLAAWRLGRAFPAAVPAFTLPATGPVRQVIECGGCGRARPYCPHCGHKLRVETVPALERI